MKRKHFEESGEVLENDDDIQYFRDEVGADPDEGTKSFQILLGTFYFNISLFSDVFAAPSGSGEKKVYGWRKRKPESDTEDGKKKFKRFQPRDDGNYRTNKKYQGRDNITNPPDKRFQGKDDGKNRPKKKFQGRDDNKNKGNKRFQGKNDGRNQSNKKFQGKREAKFPTNKFRGKNGGKNQFKSKTSNTKRKR